LMPLSDARQNNMLKVARHTIANKEILFINLWMVLNFLYFVCNNKFPVFLRKLKPQR
jgi:hypothetical protein